jgi:hypothetical protein
VVAGCHHVSAPPREGRSSFKIIEPPARAPANRPPPLDAEQQPFVNITIPAEPIEPLAKPLYPQDALTAHAGLAIVGLRIVVGTDGQVVDVGPSLLVPSLAGRYAEAFRAAAEAAVRQWRFRPAKMRRLERVASDQGPYWRAAQTEPIEASCDVAFTFNADGLVTSGPGN